MKCELYHFYLRGLHMENVNISYSSSTQCGYLIVQVHILGEKHGLEELLGFVLQVEDPM